MWKRKVVLAGLGVALAAFAMLAQPSAPARADHGGPGVHPVQRFWSVIKVKDRIGLSVGCVSLDGNPFGYYTVYTVYYGWRYVDARGVHYYGWWQEGIGPATIVGSYKTVECGIPARH